MQHLNNISDPVFSRKWNFDQNWNNAEHTLLRQNQQRSEDVDTSKKNIQEKINALTQLENTKVSVMNDNIKYLKNQSGALQKNSADTIQKATDYQNDYQNKCMQFGTNYLNNAQSFADKILAYSKNKCNEVQRKLNVVDQSIKRKTDEQMKELRQSSIDHIKSILSNESAHQKSQIQNLSNVVTTSLKNMRETLKTYEKESLKSEAQLEQKINRLDQEMYSLISNENKQGDMTYDCLLKLVQDSYGKIEYLKMR